MGGAVSSGGHCLFLLRRAMPPPDALKPRTCEIIWLWLSPELAPTRLFVWGMPRFVAFHFGFEGEYPLYCA